LTSFARATLGGEVDEQVDVVVVPVELDQLGLEVGAHPHDLLHPGEVPVTEHPVPKLRHEDQVSMQSKNTVPIGDVPVRWSRSLPSEATSVTVIRDTAGRYFASLVVQTTQDETLPPVDGKVGIDLGLTHFAVMSDGTKVTAPKFLRRAARKLKRLQQDLSRKQRGSQNRKKAVVTVARAGSFRPPGCARPVVGSTTR
jgi:hypothetical protein